jgi:hypothetical protein
VLYIADDENVAPLEKEVRNLVQGLQAVKDEQEYIVVRERVHRNTAESTNDRVKWWSIGQTIMLFAVCAWQVWYLKVCCIVCRERMNTDGGLSFHSRSSRSNVLFKHIIYRYHTSSLLSNLDMSPDM